MSHLHRHKAAAEAVAELQAAVRHIVSMRSALVELGPRPRDHKVHVAAAGGAEGLAGGTRQRSLRPFGAGGNK